MVHHLSRFTVIQLRRQERRMNALLASVKRIEERQLASPSTSDMMMLGRELSAVRQEVTAVGGWMDIYAIHLAKRGRHEDY